MHKSRTKRGEQTQTSSFYIPVMKKRHSSSELTFLITRGAALQKFLMLVPCLVCITCSGALDVSNFRLTATTLCGCTACSLRQAGVGAGAPAPVNYQLINSGSFLLVLVSACKRLFVCGIGGRHCDNGV